MKNLLKVLIFLALTLDALSSVAQTKYRLTYSKMFKAVPYVNDLPEDAEVEVIGYPPDNDMISTWERLRSAIRTPRNETLLNSIILQSSEIGNIYSYKYYFPNSSQNIIFYDKVFFTQFEGIRGIDVNYLKLFSLAHEIGHFINGDVANGLQSPDSELKADNFACSTLCELKLASEDRINNVILTLAGATDSKHYPRKGNRIKSMSHFFNNGGCVSVKKMEYEDFSSSENKWKFWICKYDRSYSAEIDPSQNAYVLTLTPYPRWGWTWIPFPPEMYELFNKSSGAQISFDLTTSEAGNWHDIFGFISRPNCVNQSSCPGGSHYDLWFERTQENGEDSYMTARFFYNDNCNCMPNVETDVMSKKLKVGERVNVRIIKQENKYSVYIDNEMLIKFNLNESLVSQILYSQGTHNIYNFRVQEF